MWITTFVAPASTISSALVPESCGLLAGLSTARRPQRSRGHVIEAIKGPPQVQTKYRVRNWPAYDRSLVARGDRTVWITPDALDAWRPAPTGRRGAQPKFSDLAIETVLTLRMVFHLPLRQAEGFLGSILRIMDLDLESPDHTTRSRRVRASCSTYGRSPATAQSIY